MAFQTRDIRGGKGERTLFYNFMKVLYTHDAEMVRRVLPLVPEYGCWRDMWELLKYIPELESDIFDVVLKTFESDLAAYETLQCESQSGLQGNESPYKNMSLLAKWLPREKSLIHNTLAVNLANFLFQGEATERARVIKYRKTVSMLNKALKTVEINMCSKSWQEIEPSQVPVRCLKTHTKAFLNEHLKAVKCGKPIIRYPNDEDRHICRQNFKEFIRRGLSTGKVDTVDTVDTVDSTVITQHEMRAILDNERYDAIRKVWNDRLF